MNSRIFGAGMLLIAALAGLAGCADNSNKPPVLANVVYELRAQPVQEGGSANVIGSFDVIERSAETAAIHTVVVDSSGKQVGGTVVQLTDAPLRISDSVGFLVQIPLSKKGEYTFRVFITDSDGRQSNSLSGTFAVTDVF